MPKLKQTSITAGPAPWHDVILICRKCSKKLRGGFGAGGEQSLGRELKRGLRNAGRRGGSRVVETKCLGICPKGGVTVVPTSQTGTVLMIPAGTDIAAVVAKLLPP